jgi:hypothetical protein
MKNQKLRGNSVGPAFRPMASACQPSPAAQNALAGQSRSARRVCDHGLVTAP